MSRKYIGGIVIKNPTAPTTSSAKGIWTLDDVSSFVKQGLWPRSPGAPTIGTATVSAITASVPFTVPADLGTGSITYTATSNPGSITATGTSPISVTGLTPATSYTFTVVGSTPGGTGPASAASNSVTATEPNFVLTSTGASTFLQSVNAGPSGTVFTAGSTAGSPNTDAFFSKVTTAGSVTAKKALSGSDYEAFRSVLVDSSGNLHAFGYNIPTGVGQGQALVMKMDSSFNITWQKKFEFTSANDEGAASGGIDSSGNVYFVSDYFNGSIRVPMVFKLNSSGAVTWARALTGAEFYPRFAVTDSSGNMYISSTHIFNPGVGAYRQVTTKMDTDGNIAWQRSLYRSSANENVNSGEGDAIFVDASGNVYVIGRCKYQGGSDNGGFIAKYNSSGTIQWNTDIGGSGRSLQLEGVIADSSGNVYGCGSDGASNKGVVFKLNSSGALQWQRHISYSGASIALAGMYTDDSFVYVSGSTSQPATGGLLVKLAVDGSGSGTTSGWVYEAATYSTASSTLTDTTGPSSSTTFSSYSTANTSLSLADRSLTDALVTF